MRRTGFGIISAHFASFAVVLAVATAALTVPAVAQDYKDYERPPIEDPVRGYERSDGILVLEDDSFCSFLLGSIWGTDELTFRSLIDKSKKQKAANKAAFQPASDAGTLATCVGVLNAFREPPVDGDAIATWARERAVVPEALAGFLAADPASDPLATAAPVGDGSRTSGFGSQTSAPFGLLEGNYHVAPDTAACDEWTGSIIDTNDPTHVLVTVDSAADLYNVDVGTYYWDVTASDCDWSVDLVAVAPLPDPTPTPRPMAEVPRLVGSGQWDPRGQNPEWLTVEAARAALDAAGLVAGSCEGVFRFPFAPRRVIEQDPPPGTIVEIGSSVNLILRGEGCDVLTAPAAPA